MPIKDISGLKFGKLTALEIRGKNKREYLWYCECDCGGNKVVPGSYLRTGHTTSCGCNIAERAKKHGMSYTGPWNSHANMKRRCNNPKHKDYHNYGGRGITYDAAWETFEGFWEDMQSSYKEGLTIDRIDVNGNYNKENCRWATKHQQANNTRLNNFYKYKGEYLTISEICSKYGFDYELSRHRIMNGWTLEEALNTPIEQEQLSYGGEIKSVSEFAKEYGLTYHQLKKRLMRGWTVERALTQPLLKR